MATAEEIVVKLTAQTAELKAGMAEGVSTVKAAQDEMAASYANTMGVFQQFDAIQKGSIKTAQDVAAAQDVLTAAEKTGAFTAEELAAKQAILSAAMTKLPQEAEAASSGLAAALTRNSRVAYSSSALISDALTGQFSRSRREVAALANETGLMAQALRFLLGPVGLTVAGIAAVGFSAIEAQRNFEKFEDVIQLTNGTLGVTAGQLQDIAEKIGDSSKDYSDASTAVRDLGASGQFTADQLQVAAQTSVQFAQLTGEKVSETDKLLVEMATHPQKALDELVDKYHRITPAQADVIQGFLKQGDTAKAVETLITDFAASVNDSVDKEAKHASWLAKAWDDAAASVSKYFRTFGESVDVSTGGGDAAMKLRLLKEQIDSQATPGEKSAMAAYLKPQIDALQKIVDQENAAAAAAKKRADAYKDMHPEKGSFAALQKEGFGGIDLSGNLNKQLHDLEAAQKVSYGDREEFEREYWGTILQTAKSGTAAYVQAWQQVQSGQQRLDQQQLQESEEAARKQAEASRKATEDAKRRHEEDARAALNALNIKRDATQQYSSLRVQIDAEIVQAAIQWYGRDSTAYRQALRQKQADAEAWAKHETQIAVQGASDKHAAALQDIQDSNQAAQEAFRNGEISAQQLLAVELQNNTKKIASDVEYYNTREQLAGADTKTIEAFEAKLTQAIKKANAERVKDTSDAQKQIAQNYVRMMQPVTNAIQQSVNGMIMGTQTARQALANIGQSIVAEFISQEAKKLEVHIANELARTSVTETGNAARVAADTAGQAQSLAVQGESAIKWITTEAAKAAAGAFNALVSIPYVGPFLAVGASIAAGAAVLAMIGRVASAEGGWERVPGDGVMTQLHKDEMVLPKRVADPIRNMARGGGNGGPMNVHIHTTDSRNLTSYLKRNPRALSAALAHAARNGW